MPLVCLLEVTSRTTDVYHLQRIPGSGMSPVSSGAGRFIAAHVPRVLRQVFAAMPVEQKLMVLAASSGATTNRYRRALELRPAQPGAAEASPPREEDGQGGASDQPLGAVGDDHARPVVPRATRRRLMYNLTVPKILPTPRLRALLVRHAVDHPSRPSHAMLSLAPCGSVRVWQYVVGSATAGMRYYKDAEGSRKRLAAPYLRNKLRNSQGGGSQCAKLAVSDAVDVVDAVDAITAAGAMSEEDKVALFQITRTTHLEFDDGTGRVVVVAIEFDAAHSVQQAISKDGVAVPQQSLAGLIAETTLAADGGPVMRCSMTLFAMCLSTSVLRTAKSSTGRTGLLPLLLMLSGEQAIHSALSDRLWRGVNALLERPYVIRLVPDGDTGIRWATLRLPRLVRLCGDFAMQSHYLSISGGIHRCPGQWPCLPYRYIVGDRNHCISLHVFLYFNACLKCSRYRQMLATQAPKKGSKNGVMHHTPRVLHPVTHLNAS